MVVGLAICGKPEDGGRSDRHGQIRRWRAQYVNRVFDWWGLGVWRLGGEGLNVRMTILKRLSSTQARDGWGSLRVFAVVPITGDRVVKKRFTIG